MDLNQNGNLPQFILHVNGYYRFWYSGSVLVEGILLYKRDIIEMYCEHLTVILNLPVKYE